MITSESYSDTSSPDAASRQVHKPTTHNAPDQAERGTKFLRRQTTDMAEHVVKDRTHVARSPVRASQAQTQPPVQPQQHSNNAPRISARKTKGVAPRRFSPTTNAVLIALTLFYLFALASGQNVILVQSYGAVAEKCGQVAIDDGTAFFSMVLRLHISHDETHMSQCLPDMHQERFLELDNQLCTPTWMAASNELKVTAYTAIARKQTLRLTTDERPQPEFSEDTPEVNTITTTESAIVEDDNS